MDIHLSSNSPATVEAEFLAVVVVDENEASNAGSKSKPKVLSADLAVSEAAKDLIASGELTGRAFETALVHRPQGLKAKRILFIGGGKSKTFGNTELRRVAGAAVRFAKPKQIKSFAFAVPEIGSAADAIRASVEGAVAADFDPDTYKSDRKDQRINAVTLVTSADKNTAEAAVNDGRIIGESQNFARMLVNEPSNRMTPTKMGELAKQMSKEVGLKCEVYGADKIKELKMGAFWSVAQGSDEPPALIVMTYEPAGAPANPVLGLVGKGVTFDTGGISIKPSDGMEKMKYDMAGGATMIGAMRAIALLKPKVKVIGIVCATENMPSGKAQKPGDVQIAMSGKSIEIINTDAEGRLVLADGLHYARQLGATHMIDAATLTGACVVALAGVNVGLFANDDTMYQRFAQAHNRAGEKMWRLPLDAEYQDLIKSNIADIVNSGGRWGGAVTAAMFLKEFVADTPWIHLDIAGTAWLEDNKAWIAKGPSGTAVRSIIEFAKDLANNGIGADGSAGFTGGTQEKQQTGTQAAQQRSDTGAGL
jgi:leucyl aminopeptidase